jgi:hypothetical protein
MKAEAEPGLSGRHRRSVGRLPCAAPNRRRQSESDVLAHPGDQLRNGRPREKMNKYMRDGRIRLAWRADIPNRCVEIWTPADTINARDVLRGDDRFEFEGVAFVVNEVFEGIEIA